MHYNFVSILMRHDYYTYDGKLSNEFKNALLKQM